MADQAVVVKEVQTRFTANIQDYRSKMRQMADAVGGTNRSLESTSRVGATVQKRLSGLGTRMSEMGSSARRSANSVSGLGSSLKKLGMVVGAALSVRAITNFGKSCLELGSDLAEVENVVDVTFSSMSGQVDRFAKSAARQFGLSETMAKRYAGTFGAMSKAFGFSEQQAYNMSTALTGLAGDVASFYNITQDEAYTKLKSVFTGETESLKDLGVVMTQTALDQFALSNGFGKTTKAMTEQEKVALRYAFVQKQLATASGDFARTSDGWANQVRILKLQIDSLKASIGQGLINALTPAIKAVNTLIGRLVVLADQFRAFTEMIAGKKSSGGSGLGAAASAAADVTQNTEAAADASDALTNSTQKAGEAAKKAAKELRNLMGFDEINKLAEKDDTADSVSPDSTTGAAGAVPTAVQDLGNALTGATGGLASQLDDLAKKLANIWDVFKKAWDLEGAATIKTAQDMMKSLKKLAQDIGNTFYRVFTDGYGFDWVVSGLQLLQSVFKVVKAISDAFDTAWNDDGNGYNYVASIFRMFTNINNLLRDINLSFIEAWNDNGLGVSIATHLLHIFTNVNDIIGNLAGSIDRAWKKSGNGTRIWKGILGLVDRLLKSVDKVTKATAKWADKVDFSPMLKSFGDLLDALNPLADILLGDLEKGYEDILLPLATWMIEDAAPKSIDILTSSAETLSTTLKLLDDVYQKLKEHGLDPEKLFTAQLERLSGLLEDVAGAIDLVNEGLKGLDNLLNGDSLDPVSALKWVGDFQTAITNLADDLVHLTNPGTAIGEWIGEAIGDGLANGLSNAKEKISNWFADRKKDLKNYGDEWKRLGSDLGSFTVKVKDTSATWWKNVKKWWNRRAGDAGSFKTSVKDQSKVWWKNVKDWWAGKVGRVTDFETGVKNQSRTWWQNTKSWWSEKVGNVAQFLTGVKDQSRTWWGNTKTWWSDKVGSVASFTVNVKNDAITWWNNVKDWWSRTAGELWTSLNIRLPRIDWHWDNSWGISIPVFDGISWYAKGGILNGAQLFGAMGSTLLGGGESGREAVLPLDRNTEWMDRIADKVAERMYEAPEPLCSVSPSSGGDSSSLSELLTLLRDVRSDLAAMRRDSDYGNAQPLVVQCVLDGKVVAQSSVRHINRQAQATSVNPLSTYF